jgi:hypothetical protein
VARAAEIVRRIDFAALLDALPADEAEAASLIGHGAGRILGGPKAYALGHFKRPARVLPCRIPTPPARRLLAGLTRASA